MEIEWVCVCVSERERERETKNRQTEENLPSRARRYLGDLSGKQGVLVPVAAGQRVQD